MKAEVVAHRAAKDARSYLESHAAIGEHLADQLILPMALAGGGSFTTTTISSHLETNLQVVQMFLPIEFEVIQIERANQVKTRQVAAMMPR